MAKFDEIELKQLKSRFQVVPKIEITDSKILSLVYTPGVGSSCQEIKQNPHKSFELTNRANSAAVFFSETDKDDFIVNKLKIYKQLTGIDCYPFLLNTGNPDKFVQIVLSLIPSFGYIVLSNLSCTAIADIFPLLVRHDIPIEIFRADSEFLTKKALKFTDANLNSTDNNVNKLSLELHNKLIGVVTTNIADYEQNLSENNLIAIITDGTAVLGFGNLGPEAALPVMEGKSVLFSSLGGVSAVPICLKTKNSDEFIETVKELAIVFSGINLEDIAAPDCFKIETELINSLNIPVFHDDQHGTAVVVLAGFLNALKLIEKNIDEVKVVINGAGAAAIAVTNLLLKAGVKNLILCDRTGIICKSRSNMNPYKEDISGRTNPDNLSGALSDALENADFFIGLSAGNILKPEHIKNMSTKPVIFALANPIPEIMPDIALEAGAYIVATGRSDFKNQINNSLAFPGIFRGALDSKAPRITDEMKIASAIAISSLVQENDLCPDYIIPNALDKKVAKAVAEAIYSIAKSLGYG